MSRPDPRRVAVSGGADLGQNPFGALGNLTLSSSPGTPQPDTTSVQSTHTAKSAKNRGRVDVLRSTAGRGGKTVTVAKNFIGIGELEKVALCKAMRAAAGCGGTIKDGQIEIQGDQREVVMRILTEAGFRPVAAGG